METSHDVIHMRCPQLSTFNYFMFYRLSAINHVFICSLPKETIAYLAPCEKSHQAKKHFIKNLHTNWSSIKGLTDTLALSGGPEIKTTGSELRKVCSPSPRCAGGILQDKQRECLALVVSHRSRSSYTWQRPRHTQSNTADVCKTIRRGRKMESLEEEEKGTPRNTWRGWKMNEWNGTAAWPRWKLWE